MATSDAANMEELFHVVGTAHKTGHVLQLGLEIAEKAGSKLLFVLEVTNFVLALAEVALAYAGTLYEAVEIVEERGFKNGYSIGVAAGIDGYDRNFIRNNFDRTFHSVLFAPGRGIYEHNAYITGLALGYSEGSSLDRNAKKALLQDLATRIFEDYGGRPSWADTASGPDRVLYFAGAFWKAHFR